MNSHATMERQADSGAPARRGGLLQRKCACGTHTPGGGQCESCAAKQRGMQRKLSVGASNDALELEADRVASQVLAEPGPGAVSAAPPRIQRAQAQEAAADDAQEAPDSVEQTLGEGGRPLDGGVRKDMEQRFAHDFSQVRVHTGQRAAQSADEVGAQAYTVGRDVVFGERQFAPASNAGRQLLAHELTHVVQQGGGNSVLRAKPNPQKAGKTAQAGKPAAPKKPAIPKICGRPSKKVKDNEITKISINVQSFKMTLTWKDASKIPPGGTGPFEVNPGAGLCCVDCDDDKVSQTTGSLCTPKGTWKVSHVDCVLSPKHKDATNATFFQRSGIAIHTGNLGARPHSHGCSRTEESTSALVHDNVVPQSTDVEVSGTWSGSTCYKTENAQTTVPRSSVCDGFKLKPPPTPKPKGKGKTKAPPKANAPATVPSETPQSNPPVPVAEADQAPDQDLLAALPDAGQEPQFGVIPDGPGPDNSPASPGDVEVPLEMIADSDDTTDVNDATPAAGDDTTEAVA